MKTFFLNNMGNVNKIITEKKLLFQLQSTPIVIYYIGIMQRLCYVRLNLCSNTKLKY